MIKLKQFSDIVGTHLIKNNFSSIFKSVEANISVAFFPNVSRSNLNSLTTLTGF